MKKLASFLKFAVIIAIGILIGKFYLNDTSSTVPIPSTIKYRYTGQNSTNDPGAEITFNEKTLRGGFKVPSLRNITKTAPYSHSGAFKNLKEAIRFYTLGRGHAVPEGEKLTLHWHIWEPQLCLLYTSPSPRDATLSRMPSSA